MADTVFTSNLHFEDAEYQANANGYVVVGRARNKKGQFVVFANKFRM